jgi:DNA-directed RNA polymerase subunit RPC12/RpoP
MSLMLRSMSAARWVFVSYICSQCSVHSAQSAVWERKAVDCVQCNVVHLVKTLPYKLEGCGFGS